MGRYLKNALNKLAKEKSVIKEIRGKGLMIGIELKIPAASIIEALQELGIIVIPSRTHVIRLLPPLIVQKEHIEILINGLKKVL